jgi:DNA polymerase V
MPHYITPLFNAPLKVSLFSSSVAAGIASPADDHLEAELNLNEYLVAHPSVTFFVQAKGDSMQQAGIFDKDLLIVDRSLTPKDNDIVIAAAGGQLMVKQLAVKLGKPWLYRRTRTTAHKPVKCSLITCIFLKLP